MNRREFTTSLAALAAAPALPFAAAPPVAASSAMPPGAYAWAQLIARAQNKCSPAMLARHLNLRADVATTLFNDMVSDGILRAPGMAGVARATAPIHATGAERGVQQRLGAKAKELLNATINGEDKRDGATPLVNQVDTGLGCAETASEDQPDARTNQPAQESPVRG